MPNYVYGGNNNPQSQSKRSPSGGFRGPRALQYTLDEFLFPEFLRSQKRTGSIEKALQPFLDPAAGERYVTEGAERIAADVLRPGGEVTEGIRRARGGAIASGFGTQGGDLSRQEANIVSEGLRSSVGSFIGQSLPGLYEGAAGRTFGAYSLTQQQLQDFITSLFTGQAGVESLRLGQPGLRDRLRSSIPVIGGLF